MTQARHSNTIINKTTSINPHFFNRDFLSWSFSLSSGNIRSTARSVQVNPDIILWSFLFLRILIRYRFVLFGHGNVKLKFNAASQ
jgi:hypothetical protein